jgi:hypothetical protein
MVSPAGLWRVQRFYHDHAGSVSPVQTATESDDEQLPGVKEYATGTW